MRLFTFTICLNVLATLALNAQLDEKFDLDLSKWSGNVEDFVINDEGYLQLMAASAGNSIIWAPLVYPQDWEMTIRISMKFAPSDNNKCRIYLLKEMPETDIENGYFLEIGENGSNDAIKFYQISEGSTSIVASATMGAVARDAVDVGISISRNSQPNNWNLKADYSGGTLYMPEVEFIDDIFDITGNGFLAIECIYSSTRRDKFYFDDIFISPLEEDNSPPELIKSEVMGASQILLTFDELIDEVTGEDIDNYLIEPWGYKPITAMVERNTVLLDFSQRFESGPVFSLLLEDVEDLNGNAIPLIKTMDLVYAVLPEVGDIHINEILFDPFPGEEDYIEFYNTSEKVLTLEGMTIYNADNGDMTTLASSIQMEPLSFLAISPDVESLINRYKPISDANLYQHDLPALNNDMGSISLKYNGVQIDAMNYNEGLHSPIISDTEGVSLERISIILPATEENNWTSASAINNFGTPGFKNSASIANIVNDEILTLREKSFSPNGDGHNDYMILDYNLDKPGYLANIHVYNSAGHQILNLTNSVSLATNGFIQWDGITAEGKIGRIGVYIVLVELFHPDGDVIQKKFAAVLTKDL